MFTIKVFDQQGNYTAFSAKKYDCFYTPPEPDSPIHYHASIRVHYEDGKHEDVIVGWWAYIENQAGKTIARIGEEPRPRLAA